MKSKNEIAALVSLLDDPDEIIFNQVKNQLLELGTDCIPLLEKADFENEYGEVFKSRISNITHEISLRKVLKDHSQWLNYPINLINGISQLDQYFFPNITKNYILDTGQRDNFYDIARIVRKQNVSSPTGKLIVVYDYFEHADGDVFTVDSYSDVADQMTFEDIPTYSATKIDPDSPAPTGEFPLIDCYDIDMLLLL
jgi:hypothetical protein